MQSSATHAGTAPAAAAAAPSRKRARAQPDPELDSDTEPDVPNVPDLDKDDSASSGSATGEPGEPVDEDGDGAPVPAPAPVPAGAAAATGAPVAPPKAPRAPKDKSADKAADKPRDKVAGKPKDKPKVVNKAATWPTEAMVAHNRVVIEAAAAIAQSDLDAMLAREAAAAEAGNAASGAAATEAGSRPTPVAVRARLLQANTELQELALAAGEAREAIQDADNVTGIVLKDAVSGLMDAADRVSAAAERLADAMKAARGGGGGGGGGGGSGGAGERSGPAALPAVRCLAPARRAAPRVRAMGVCALPGHTVPVELAGRVAGVFVTNAHCADTTITLLVAHPSQPSLYTLRLEVCRAAARFSSADNDPATAHPTSAGGIAMALMVADGSCYLQPAAGHFVAPWLLRTHGFALVDHQLMLTSLLPSTLVDEMGTSGIVRSTSAGGNRFKPAYQPIIKLGPTVDEAAWFRTFSAALAKGRKGGK